MGLDSQGWQPGPGEGELRTTNQVLAEETEEIKDPRS